MLNTAEYEFFQFKTPSNTSSDAQPSAAAYLRDNPPSTLPSLTEGMFGYSLTRPVHNQEYFYDVFNTCEAFQCNIEGWHTESGPGVFEAALEFGEAHQMADRAGLFKYVVKSVATKYGITPCFMAKPKQGLPGNSGHMHISIVDSSGKNLLARDTPDPNPRYPDIAHLSDLGRHFLAGLLEGLPDVMPMVAPTINSYKRLVENFWAPVTVSWGLEHRAASIRLIAPPTAKAGATRFEVRVPGADANPYYVMSAILGLGWRGVELKREIATPPLGKGEEVGGDTDMGVRLAKNLREATDRFTRTGSIAREVFGDDFVEHFGGTREHEIRLWDEAVTDWYVFPPFDEQRDANSNQGDEAVYRDGLTWRARCGLGGGSTGPVVWRETSYTFIVTCGIIFSIDYPISVFQLGCLLAVGVAGMHICWISVCRVLSVLINKSQHPSRIRPCPAQAWTT